MHLPAELRIMQQDLLRRYSLLVRKRPRYLPGTANSDVQYREISWPGACGRRSWDLRANEDTYRCLLGLHALLGAVYMVCIQEVLVRQYLRYH